MLFKISVFHKEVLFDSLGRLTTNQSSEKNVCFQRNEYDVRIAWNVEKKDYDCIDVQSFVLTSFHQNFKKDEI
jgi:hypothetical protein